MHKLLIKLAQPFVNLNFISIEEANVALQTVIKLPFWPSGFFKNEIQECKLNSPVEIFSLDEHLENLQHLKIELARFEKVFQIIENHINEIMAHFMPTNEAVQTWEPSLKYARLLLLSQYAYYIKTDQNAKNLMFPILSKYGELMISINLAKPEKTQAQILAEKNAPQTNLSEPHCGICIENLNFHGSVTKASRENLRVIYENLDSHAWFFQYSPYAYLNGHFVINDLVHTPMLIDDNTIIKLLSFVDLHPEFMLGSNADLPIVGGSLLGHNHFQGALERLPITHAESIMTCQSHNCQLEILNWPLNTIKVTSKSLTACAQLVNSLIHFWKLYQSSKIINNDNHTVTIITEKISNWYVCYVILRNNAANNIYPQGIYHVHSDKFHIKQENIGLMEAAGLAILPGRLIDEFEQIIDLYQTHAENLMSLINGNDKLQKHATWIEQLLQRHKHLTMQILLSATAEVFIAGLEDCQIFKAQEFKAWFKSFLLHHPVIIDNHCGLKLELLNQGNIVKQIYLFDQPLLLEYADVNQYFTNEILLNAFVGPACGRIEQGKIITNECTWQLPIDGKQNYLHGMQHKWSDLIYDISIEKQLERYLIVFETKQFNPDLKTNYLIKNTLSISLKTNELTFDYQVQCDRPTLCNPSHHFYWTLNEQNLNQQNLNFSPYSIWQLNENKNPTKQRNIGISGSKSITEWMQIFNNLTNQNELMIDHPFVLSDSMILFSNQMITMKMTPQIKELVIYTYFSQTPQLFKKHHNAICFESQYIPTSLQNMNVNQIITQEYRNQVKYIFKFGKHT